MLSQGVCRVAVMERTGVLNSNGGPGARLAARQAGRSNGSEVDRGSSVRNLLAAVCEALRSVSLEGLDEDGLCRVVAGAGHVNALADAVTLRAASLLEGLRAGSAREALVAGAKLSGSAAKRVTEAARQVGEMPNVAALLDSGQLPLQSVFALGSAARQCGAAAVDGSDELLYQAATRDSGSFSRVARRFAQRHDPSAGGDLLKGQRNSRKADLFIASDGMGVLKGETDSVSFGWPTVLETISPDDHIVGTIFGGNGQPLWLSRMKRLANAGQYVAVALRDRGCVLCGAPMHRCRLHHVNEFHADEGPTDIENLAALCGGCHQWLHRNNRRVVRRVDAYGTATWSTAPRDGRPRDAGERDPDGESGGGPGRADGRGRGGAPGRGSAGNGAEGLGRGPPGSG